MSSQPPEWGEQPGPPVREMSRRGFLRRAVLGRRRPADPPVRGRDRPLPVAQPQGWPGRPAPRDRQGRGHRRLSSRSGCAGCRSSTTRRELFIVNVPAAKARVDGTGEEVDDPGDDILAIYRKCPHLGCNIPPLCEKSNWFECLCHGSQVHRARREARRPRAARHGPLRSLHRGRGVRREHLGARSAARPSGPIRSTAARPRTSRIASARSSPMRMKALGVALMVAFAAFTTFYWITDAPRRGVFETETERRAARLRAAGLPVRRHLHRDGQRDPGRLRAGRPAGLPQHVHQPGQPDR